MSHYHVELSQHLYPHLHLHQTQRSPLLVKPVPEQELAQIMQWLAQGLRGSARQTRRGGLGRYIYPYQSLPDFRDIGQKQGKT